MITRGDNLFNAHPADALTPTTALLYYNNLADKKEAECLMPYG
jgi:hypothetical protein